jgi:hypothetical protein
MWMTRVGACAITKLDDKQTIMKDCGSDMGQWNEELPTVGHGWSGAAYLGVHDDVYQQHQSLLVLLKFKQQ